MEKSIASGFSLQPFRVQTFHNICLATAPSAASRRSEGRYLLYDFDPSEKHSKAQYAGATSPSCRLKKDALLRFKKTNPKNSIRVFRQTASTCTQVWSHNQQLGDFSEINLSYSMASSTGGFSIWANLPQQSILTFAQGADSILFHARMNGINLKESYVGSLAQHEHSRSVLVFLPTKYDIRD